MVDFPTPYAPGAASYPTAGPLNLDWLGNMTGAYKQGVEQKRDVDVIQAFRNGVPVVPGTEQQPGGGIPDYNAMAKKLITLGDTTQGVNLANADIVRQGQIFAARRFAEKSGAPDPYPGLPVQPAAATQPGGPVAAPGAPGMTLPPPPVVGPAAPPANVPSATVSPTGTYAGPNQPGSTMDRVVQAGIPVEHQGVVASVVARNLGLDPNQAIPPALQPRAAAIVAAAASRVPGATPQTMPAVPGAPQPIPGVPVAPGTEPPIPAPQQTAVADPTLGGLVPQGWQPGAYLNALQNRAEKLRDDASFPMAPAASKEAWLKQAEAIDKKAELISNALKTATEPTPAQKEYGADTGRRPGESFSAWQARVAGDKKHAEFTAEQYGKKYAAITDAGNQANIDIPQLKIAKSLMADPRFDSGFGAHYTQILKSVASRLPGFDPNIAVPQEAFNKVAKEMLIGGIKDLATSGVGRVTNAEVNIVNAASLSTDVSPQANRLRVEMMLRIKERQAQIADMALSHNGGNGRLDPDFDRKVARLQAKPMFTEAEMKNYKEIFAGTTQPPARTARTEPATAPPAPPASAIQILRANPDANTRAHFERTFPGVKADSYLGGR